MPRTLVIGYGNIDRADDGVAYDVINALRCSQGQEILSEDRTGIEELGAPVDSIFLSQLTPELMDLLGTYDQVIFVDAHVHANTDDLHCAPVIPEFAPPVFTHHLTPAMLIAFFAALYHREPSAHIVSIRGYDFDFHRGLSAHTQTLVAPATECILRLLK